MGVSPSWACSVQDRELLSHFAAWGPVRQHSVSNQLCLNFGQPGIPRGQPPCWGNLQPNQRRSLSLSTALPLLSRLWVAPPAPGRPGVGLASLPSAAEPACHQRSRESAKCKRGGELICMIADNLHTWPGGGLLGEFAPTA